jgi:hypothetical protein
MGPQGWVISLWTAARFQRLACLGLLGASCLNASSTHYGAGVMPAPIGPGFKMSYYGKNAELAYSVHGHRYAGS